jgi:hypothetical protein
MDSHANPRRRAGGRQVVTRIACAAIICAAAVAFGLSVNQGIQSTAAVLNPESSQEWARFDSQQACIYHAIRSKLPKGAKIFIKDPVVYDAQRLAELSALWAVPQPTQATARWTLSLVRGQDCTGLSVRVRPT